MSRLRPLLPSCLPAMYLAVAVAAATPALAAADLADRGTFEAEARAVVPAAGPSYPYLRCAALYRALRLAARSTDGAAERASATPGERALIDEAARARVERTGLRRVQVGAQVEGDIAALGRLYTGRFETLAERDADRWWDDPLVETDLRACGLLLESLGAAGRSDAPQAGQGAPDPELSAEPGAAQR
ncbi:hypothetical protein DLJ49_04465 [Rhodovulum sp. 12E13]|uniref:hypothetical protein n=1 Tax=Rhodovulum sp. 12E13 TaxID=2203891 RepID=UPI000E11977B|nr:hypothetical protein [Rhodovulum sp. 12E13]RDC74545.1 hypothetical protein DLJ49_04465 [Rhodovulum sp. 12E13]